MTTTWPISTYPLALDTFTPALLDGVDEVLANHQNVPAQALVAVQTKLGIDGSPVTGLGGVSFDPAGKAAFPGVAGSPTIWVNNAAPSFSLMYTDERGFDFTLVTTVSGTLQAAYNAGNTIVTSGGRPLDIQGSEKVYLVSSNVAADAIKLSAAGGLDLDSGASGITINASGATGSDITVATSSGGTGNISISSSGATGGVISISATGGAPSLTLSCTSGVTTLSSSGNNVAVTSGAVLDMDGVSVTLDSATTLSLDSTDNSNFTITANSAANKTLTISVTNAGVGNGNISVSADYIGVTSTGDVSIGGVGLVSLASSAGSFDLNAATTGYITTTDGLTIKSVSSNIVVSTGFSSSISIYSGNPGIPGLSSYFNLTIGAAGANGTAVLYSKDISITTEIAAGNRVYINTYDFSCFADNSIAIATLHLGSPVTIDSTGVLELNSSTDVISIGNDAVAQNINIGTGAAARTITVGNVTGATSLVLNSGTGGISLTSTGAGDILLNSSDTVLIDSVGVLELNSSAGVISIGNDAIAQAINIGTGAAARPITIGNITSGTSLTLNANTGGIALNVEAGSLQLHYSGPGNKPVFAVESSSANISSTDAVNLNATTSGNIYLNGGIKHKVTTVAAAVYTALVIDSILMISYTSTGTVSILIPSLEIAKAGRIFTIIDSGGNSSINNINIETEGAEKISGEASLIMDVDYMVITLMSDGTNLFVV